MTHLGKTAWVDKLLTQNWDRIASVAESPEFMPRHEMKRTKRVAEEFGCGSYGCVMPTSSPGVVVKLTTDASEAAFIAWALTLPQPGQGLVRYFRIARLAGVVHRNRPVFVLWRSEANHVGGYNRFNTDLLIRDGLMSEWQAHAYKLGSMRLMPRLLAFAGVARKTMVDALKRRTPDQVPAFYEQVWRRFDTMQLNDPDDWLRNFGPYEQTRAALAYAARFKGVDKIAACARIADMTAIELENTDLWYPVGQAIHHYADMGLLLADVHLNNIGVDADGRMVITDPGHVMPFHPQFATPVVIPEV